MLREPFRLVNLLERLMVSTGHTSYDVSMLLFNHPHKQNKSVSYEKITANSDFQIFNANVGRTYM